MSLPKQRRSSWGVIIKLKPERWEGVNYVKTGIDVSLGRWHNCLSYRKKALECIILTRRVGPGHVGLSGLSQQFYLYCKADGKAIKRESR